MLSHFEPSKFNIALAIHVYDNALAFGPRDFAAN